MKPYRVGDLQFKDITQIGSTTMPLPRTVGPSFTCSAALYDPANPRFVLKLFYNVQRMDDGSVYVRL